VARSRYHFVAARSARFVSAMAADCQFAELPEFAREEAAAGM
jgi:hypothetical protein